MAAGRGGRASATGSRRREPGQKLPLPDAVTDLRSLVDEGGGAPLIGDLPDDPVGDPAASQQNDPASQQKNVATQQAIMARPDGRLPEAIHPRAAALLAGVPQA